MTGRARSPDLRHGWRRGSGAVAVDLAPRSVCVGNGARRYRDLLAARGAEVPPDDSDLHVPRASLHASLAASFGPGDAVAPVYVREPDASRWVG